MSENRKSLISAYDREKTTDFQIILCFIIL